MNITINWILFFGLCLGTLFLIGLVSFFMWLEESNLPSPLKWFVGGMFVLACFFIVSAIVH